MKKEQNTRTKEMHSCSSMDLYFLSVLSSGNLLLRAILFLIAVLLKPHFYKLHKYSFHQESLCSIQTFPGNHYIHFLLACCFFRDSSKVSIFYKNFRHDFIPTNISSKRSVLLKLRCMVHF